MAGTKRIDKPCEDCGVLLVNVVPTRKYCYDCAKKRQKVSKKQYRTVKEKNRKDTVAPIPNPNSKYCKGCIYWGGAYEGYETCNYIFIKKHRRPCPAGKDCTEKIIGKRMRTMEFGENRE